MAREALTRLANTEQDARRGQRRAVGRRGASPTRSTPPRASSASTSSSQRDGRRCGAPIVPGRVARALTLAATQARRERPAARRRRAGSAVAVIEARRAAVRVEVRDAGEGFDLEGVPDDRLGIRASIIARVAAVGGAADIETGDSGTIVRLAWRETAA